jgi:hypothetical protein
MYRKTQQGTNTAQARRIAMVVVRLFLPQHFVNQSLFRSYPRVAMGRVTRNKDSKSAVDGR